MNYRFIILDYFYQYLNSQGVKQATFCFLDRNYTDNLSKCLYDNQLVRAYHIKPPRVFFKEYELNKIEGTLLEMVMDVREQLSFSYSDFTYKMLDPYYFKDFRSLEFKYLHAIPLYTDEILNVVVFAYSDNQAIELKTTTLNQLQNKLLADETLYLTNTLNELRLANSSDFTIFNLKNSSLYLSKNLQTLLKHSTNYCNGLNDKKTFLNITKRVEQFEKANYVIAKTNLLGSQITFYRLVSKTITKPLYAFEQLKLQPYTDHYTVFYFTSNHFENYRVGDFLDDVKKAMREAFIDEYDLYQYNQNTLCLIVPCLLEQRFMRKIEGSFNKKAGFKCLSVNTAYDIGIYVDFEALFAYLTETENFSKQGFIEYLHLRQEAILESEYNIGFTAKPQLLFETLTKEVIGKYYGYEHLDLKKEQKDFFFLHASEKILMEVTQIDFEKDPTPLIIRCNYKMFNSKKIWYALKRLVNCPHKTIILSEVAISSNDAFNRFIKVIHRLHQENFQIYFDSSVFANIMLADIIHLYEGIYLEEYEMSLGDEEQDNLFKTVITFYLKENKMIILNIKNNKGIEYIHKNIFYLNESYVNDD